jgi:hypothetical protein
MDERVPTILCVDDDRGASREGLPEGPQAARGRRTVFCTGDVIGAETRDLIAATGCPSVSKPFEWARFFETVAAAASR